VSDEIDQTVEAEEFSVEDELTIMGLKVTWRPT